MSKVSNTTCPICGGHEPRYEYEPEFRICASQSCRSKAGGLLACRSDEDFASLGRWLAGKSDNSKWVSYLLTDFLESHNYHVLVQVMAALFKQDTVLYVDLVAHGLAQLFSEKTFHGMIYDKPGHRKGKVTFAIISKIEEEA